MVGQEEEPWLQWRQRQKRKKERKTFLIHQKTQSTGGQWGWGWLYRLSSSSTGRNWSSERVGGFPGHTAGEETEQQNRDMTPGSSEVQVMGSEAALCFTGCPSSERCAHRCPRHPGRGVCSPGNRTEAGSVSKCPGVSGAEVILRSEQRAETQAAGGKPAGTGDQPSICPPTPW